MGQIFELVKQKAQPTQERLHARGFTLKRTLIGVFALGLFVENSQGDAIIKDTASVATQGLVAGVKAGVSFAGEIVTGIWDGAHLGMDDANDGEVNSETPGITNSSEGAPVVEVPPTAAPTETVPTPPLSNNLGLVTCASVEVLLVGEGAGSYAAVVLPASPAIPETATDARRQIVEASLALTPELDPTTLRVGDAIKAMTDCELN